MQLKKYVVSCALLVCGACASNSGVVKGAADTHCAGTTPQPASAFSCPTGVSTIVNADTSGTSDFGATMYNDQGDDDDCKYSVKWSATNVVENADVTFTAVVKWLADNTPVTGSPADATSIEAFLTDTHPAPNSNQTSKESPKGTYAIGPIRFDAKGQWTVRFHIYEDCNDGDGSLHGHAAFYVNVE